MEEYGLDVRVMKLDAPGLDDQREALSELAWYEQVEAAEREVPIMVTGPAAAALVWRGSAVVGHLAGMAMTTRGIGRAEINKLLEAA